MSLTPQSYPRVDRTQFFVPRKFRVVATTGFTSNNLLVTNLFPQSPHKRLDFFSCPGGSGSTIAEVNQLLRQYEQMKKMMAQMNRGGLLGGLGRKMAGGLDCGLGNKLGGSGGMGGLGGMLGSGSDFDDDDQNGSAARGIRKKKRHKKRR